MNLSLLSSLARKVIRWPLVMLDELVAVLISVVLTLTLRDWEITLMRLHAVVLSVHVVLTYVWLRSLRGILRRSLPMVRAVLVGSRSGSRRLRPMSRRKLGAVLRIVVVRAWLCSRCRQSVTSISLVLLEWILVANDSCRRLRFLATDECAVGERSGLWILPSRDLLIH